ncbi:lipase member H-like [Diorhabda carinulata]|uniref:lipase member H-like n=1 Tax=Diorhabda carinulata TaxID=1163345 RepID=UPI0025A00F1C|nr:lipase member H-like [Diorhabda carinulata]
MLSYQVSIFSSGASYCNNYSRNLLQKEYPGYGKDFVLFPGDKGEEMYGYLTDKNSNRLGLDIVQLYNSFLGNAEELITFTLYTRKNREGYTFVNFQELSLNITKKTKFITHGWMSSGTRNLAIGIKNAFLLKKDVNVFIMDWEPIAANILYPVPMYKTPDVGQALAQFINTLIEKKHLNPKDVHLIGHSLGAHVVGFAGRLVKEKVGRITGLDPALPGFDIGLVKGGHLNQQDADFVDVIHTCAGYLGVKQPIGHVDFYPNGGSPPQPGCTILKFIEACSHGRSWILYANSIKMSQHYLGRKCKTLNDVLESKCDGEHISMGEPTPFHARGIYYVETTDQDPFIKKTNFIDDNKL